MNTPEEQPTTKTEDTAVDAATTPKEPDAKETVEAEAQPESAESKRIVELSAEAKRYRLKAKDLEAKLSDAANAASAKQEELDKAKQAYEANLHGLRLQIVKDAIIQANEGASGDWDPTGPQMVRRSLNELLDHLETCLSIMYKNHPPARTNSNWVGVENVDELFDGDSPDINERQLRFAAGRIIADLLNRFPMLKADRSARSSDLAAGMGRVRIQQPIQPSVIGRVLTNQQHGRW